MTETCGRCGRPIGDSTTLGRLALCHRGIGPLGYDYACDLVFAAYQRGLREGRRQGVEIAKERARAKSMSPFAIDWLDVDAELERMERDV